MNEKQLGTCDNSNHPSTPHEYVSDPTAASAEESNECIDWAPEEA